MLGMFFSGLQEASPWRCSGMDTLRTLAKSRKPICHGQWVRELRGFGKLYQVDRDPVWYAFHPELGKILVRVSSFYDTVLYVGTRMRDPKRTSYSWKATLQQEGSPDEVVVEVRTMGEGERVQKRKAEFGRKMEWRFGFNPVKDDEA